MKGKFLALQGLTPGKAILIGVLGVVLVTVIVLQLTPATPAPPALRARPAAAASGKGAPGIGASGKAGALETAKTASQGLANPQGLPANLLPPAQPPWPEHSLESVLMHDPFAPPQWLVASERIDREDEAASADDTQGKASADQELLSQLKSSGVSMVVIADDQRVAFVGEHALRIGDKIGGFVVQDINTNGVTLAQGDRP